MVMFWASVSYVDKIISLSNIEKKRDLTAITGAFDLPAFPGNLSTPDFKMLEILRRIYFMCFVHLIN